MKKACEKDKSLAKGLNIVKGEIVYEELEGIFD